MIDSIRTGGRITVACDMDGLIRVTGRGFWSNELVRAYLAEVTTIVAKQCLRHQGIRMFINVTHAAVQSTDTAITLSAAAKAMSGPGDNIAVVTTSALVKLQGDRVGRQQENHRAFRSAEGLSCG